MAHTILTGTNEEKTDGAHERDRSLEAQSRESGLRRTGTNAQAAQKSKDVFLAVISHEIRTPLNGILGMLQLLQHASLPRELQGLVEAANASGRVLVRIISDILDYSRLESGELELLPEAFNFKQAVLSCVTLFKEEAERKRLTLSVTLDPAVPQFLVGDEARVRQVLFNLMANAIKFTECGGVTVRCSLVDGTEQARESGCVPVRLTVSDTGIGIPGEKQKEVFESFGRADFELNRRYAGSGLGLGIVKHLVGMMGGEVALSSVEGKGTTVFCTFAFGVPDEADAAPLAGDGESCVSPPPLDILVAEDDAVSRLAIRRFIERAGHRALCVTNGREALEALQVYPFHCLFTDIQMPFMDGMELARRIRENAVAEFPPGEDVLEIVQAQFDKNVMPGRGVNPSCIIVAVSAHTMKGDEQRFLEQGIDYYLPKPLVARELLGVIGEIARRMPAAQTRAL